MENKKYHWVQTEKAAHEAWMYLMDHSPTAAKLMHLLVSRIGTHNAVVVSQKTLANLLGVKSRVTIWNAINILVAGNWIEKRQIGKSGTVNAYIINDRVAWSGNRDGLRYSLFTANVVVSEDEQPDKKLLGNQTALRKIPALFASERQLPVGAGLPPVSSPALPGMEPDLPATARTDNPDLENFDPETGEIKRK